MKIILIAPQPFYAQRGTPIAVRLLAEELGRMGHEIDLLTYWEGTDVDIPGVTLVRATKIPGVRNIPIGFSVRKLLADCSLLFTFIRLIASRRYAVVHAVEETVFFAVLTRWLHRAKIIYDMDSSLAQQMSREFASAKFLHSVFRSMENFAIKRSDIIVAVCDDLAATARRIVDPANVFVLNDVVPPEAKSEPATDQLRDFGDPDDILALYVGNLESYQGVDLLVGAAEFLPSHTRLRIVIVGGSSDDIEKYRHEIASRSLDDRIILLGQRPLTQLMSYLQQADVLLSPRSSGNNTPLKIYCYMSAGKAIVATDIVSHTQVLTNHIAKLVPATANAIADALVELASDTELRATLGKRAQAEAESKYTLEAFRTTLAATYSKSME